jgi:hypothetical protein
MEGSKLLKDIGVAVLVDLHTGPFPIVRGGVVYYYVIKRELNRRPMYKFRCDERLKPKAEGSTRLTYTRLHGELEHLKIETRLINERFCECDW